MSGAFYFFWGAGALTISSLLMYLFGNNAFLIPAKYTAIFGGSVAFVIAIYEAWSNERNYVRNLEEQLEPKLRLHFDPKNTGCVHKTNQGTSSELLMVRILPQCQSSVDECQGFMKAVYELDGNNKWQPTPFEERLDLIWGMKDQHPITIQRGVPQYLDIFQIHNARKKIELCSPFIPNRATSVFKQDGTYRIDIGVTGEESADASISLKIKMGAQWDKPEIEIIPQ